MSLSRVLAVSVIAAISVVLPAATASANSLPNSFTPSGSSWVNVPTADRVYLENFGNDYDDADIYYVGPGITCTYNSITATGPFLTGENLGTSECVDSTSTPVDPIDTSTRAGSVNFGFPINFFGTTYTSAYPNTNGGIFFDNPNSDYDATLAILANNSQSSAMFPLGADLYYALSESNFWIGQTTVNGSPAVVFSWEKFHNCCNSPVSSEDMSFQLVLIQVGSSDFDAWFNYESFNDFTEGYNAPTALINLHSGVTPGSNVVVAQNVTGISSSCTEGYTDDLGTATDTTFVNDLGGAVYFSLVDAATRKISLWSDVACTVPINANVVQDESTDKVAYVQISDNAPAYFSVGTGWSTYNPATAAIDATELLYNVDASQLENSATNPLRSRSLNTTVPGRFVIGQRGGSTVGAPGTATTTTTAAAGPSLAATGSSNGTGLAIAGGAFLILGIALVAVRRMRRKSI